MFVTLKDLVLAPRLWLSAGVFCFGASIVIGYHQDQMVAETTLAQKISLPEKVSVQDFSSDRHENALSEVNILAEVALERMVRIDVGNETSPRVVDVVPIYPVSRQTFPIANSILTSKQRPVARDDAPKIAARNEQLERVENVPVGLLIMEADSSNNFDNLMVAAGQNGPLVDVSGVLIGASSIVENAESPLAEMGVVLISGAIVVSPYLNGRATAGDIADYTALRETLFWVSLGMFAVGGASLFSIFPKFKKKKQPASAHQVKAVGAFPAIDPFQPIADQNEIADENSPPKRISRVLTAAVDTFRTRSQL